MWEQTNYTPPFQIMDLLEAIQSICPINEEIARAVLEVTKRRTLPKGTILLTEGQSSNEVYFIEKGLIRAFYFKNNREVTSWIAEEGRFIWPLPSYLLRRPSGENIQALESTTITYVGNQDLEGLKSQHKALRDIECRVMERYIIMYDIRVKILLIPKAEERLKVYVRMFPEVHRRVPLRYIATYLGIDPATLSRIRGNYKKKI